MSAIVTIYEQTTINTDSIDVILTDGQTTETITFSTESDFSDFLSNTELDSIEYRFESI